MRGVVLPDVVEMGELGAESAVIVPDAGQDGLNLLGRFLREGGGEIGATDAVFARQRPDPARDAAEQVSGLDGIEIAGRALQSEGQRAEGGLGERLGGVANPGLGTSQQGMHG